MKRSVRLLVVAAALGLARQVAVAAGAELDTILSQLQAPAPPDEARQVAAAIASSPALSADLEALAAARRFSGFVVAPRAQVNDGRMGLFGGFTQGPRIVLTTELLGELRKSRLYDVAMPDEILPNNTVFALSHLAYHLQTPLDPRKYSSPAAFSEAALAIEAGAFIHAWNATLQVAEASNGGKALSVAQVVQLTMNLRYRFAFLGGATRPDAVLKRDARGAIEATDANAQIIAGTLRNARRADLE